jgi:4-amino-4-deoxy-L-arabinose transferase-like glycosyltransferase
VVAGLGLEEKYSIAVFGLGIVVGLLLTEQRRVFLDKWIWLGGLAAFLIFFPNVLWNIKYDWPFVQLMRAVRSEGRDVVLGPLPYFFQQTLSVNPLTALIWLAGLFALLFSARLNPYRVLGWCHLVSYTVFFVLHGKNYYLAPIYPMLLAAGAVVIESTIDGRKNARPRRQWPKPAIALVLLASGAHLAPVVPVLSPDGFLAYTKYLPFKLPVMEHSHTRAALPQFWGCMAQSSSCRRTVPASQSQSQAEGGLPAILGGRPRFQFGKIARKDCENRGVLRGRQIA